MGVSLLVALFLFFSLLTQPSQPKSLKEIYKESRDSVLLLIAKEKDEEVSTGTAFAIDSDGSFVTAWHVIEDAEELLLVNSQKETFLVKDVLWQDKDLDLAILKVEGAHFKPIPLSSYKDAEVGENLTIISYPKGLEAGGLENSLSKGLLSSIRERFVSERDEPYSPIYNKDEPKVFKEKDFLSAFYENCSIVSSDPSGGMDLFSCKDNQYAIVDRMRNNSIIFDNLDLAIKIEESIFFFENKNKNKPKVYRHIGAMIQYTTPISNGSSGGPILNEDGEVIAVVNSYLDGAQNINFGRPVDYIPSKFLFKNKLAVRNFQTNSVPLLAKNTKVNQDLCTDGIISLNSNLKILKCANDQFVVVENSDGTLFSENKFELLMRNFMPLKESLKNP